MNISDFVTVDRYEEIKKKIKNREPFVIDAAKKEKGTSYRVVIDGRNIDEVLAERVWNGHNYIVGFSSDYSGKLGFGGGGGATDVFDFAESWDSFRKWFNSKMKRYENYEAEEYGQICLF